MICQPTGRHSLTGLVKLLARKEMTKQHGQTATAFQKNCRCQFLLIASNKDEYIPLDKAPQTPNMVVALKDAGCHVSDFVDDFGGHWELVTNPNKLVDMVSDYTAKLEGPTAVATC
eukprot:TRINITY_DN48188_c0_g1_i2.p3 TRINITY_DN48188_c0_g1~~TRINITY_DN48188_c0_g1_i2.p3  ORF type:complete len:116 (+),score=11.32 TRINITY_DN48188_c0_g1_i2:488-835(+)